MTTEPTEKECEEALEKLDSIMDRASEITNVPPINGKHRMIPIIQEFVRMHDNPENQGENHGNKKSN